MIFMFTVSPVNALSYEENVNNNIQYKLEKDTRKKDDGDSNGFGFWGLLFIAFLAISVFIIAYKSDDGMPDD